jgi:hypothetical protein
MTTQDNALASTVVGLVQALNCMVLHCCKWLSVVRGPFARTNASQIRSRSPQPRPLTPAHDALHCPLSTL